MKGNLNLAGLSGYLEDLAKASKDVDKAAQTALIQGGSVIETEMLKRVPVGKASEGDQHPGNLKNHISAAQPQQTGNYSYVLIGVQNADANTAIYGNVQEYGSASNAAQPYIRPSFKSKRSAALKAMKNSLIADGDL